MTGDVQVTFDAGNGPVTMDWSIDRMTKGPNGLFALLDEDGTPRLLLEKDEMMDMWGGGE